MFNSQTVPSLLSTLSQIKFSNHQSTIKEGEQSPSKKHSNVWPNHHVLTISCAKSHKIFWFISAQQLRWNWLAGDPHIKYFVSKYILRFSSSVTWVWWTRNINYFFQLAVIHTYVLENTTGRQHLLSKCEKFRVDWMSNQETTWEIIPRGFHSSPRWLAH